MFSPIGKKKVLVELKRVPLERREEYLKRVNSPTKKLLNRSQLSPVASKSPPRARTPLIQSVGAGKSATRNLEYIMQEDSLMGEVCRRITEVAVRYRRERDSVALTVFNTNSLSYQEFRDHLYRSFRLKFSDEEFDACTKLFDNDGDQNIDGSEFLVCFTKMASIKKAKIAAEVREKQKEYELSQKEEAEQHRHELEKKMEMAVDYEFTEEIRERAVAKMTLAAKRYDKNHPSAVSLDAFNGEILAPAQFKEVLKMTFGLKLNAKELGALVREFDKNGDGNIECSEFLITFFKLGFAAREQEVKEQREKQRLLDIQAEEERAAKLKAQEEKMELKVDYDFSEADEARMHAKLKEAAKKYDKNHPSAVSLEGFDAQFLTPGVFREMLRRTFNLSLTGKELGAAVKTFDKTGDSTVPCRDFLVHFFQVGYAERNRDRLTQMAKQRELDAIAEKERERKLKAADEKEHVAIAHECEESDRDRAIRKLRVAASKYDKNHPSSVGLDGFNGKFMKPGVFREMVKRTFNVILDPRELLAMVTEFDSEKNNTVNCADFLKLFFKMGFEERFAAHSNQLEKQRAAQRAMVEEAKKREQEKAMKHELEVDYDYKEEDRISALEKMAAAAVKYDKNHASAVSLVGFEGAFMSPYVFKDQIFRTFNIKLTPKELGALMKHFDRDGDGHVDCSEFLLAFLKLGFDKRSEWHKEQIKKQRDENRQREREAAMKLQEQEDKMNLKLNWDFTDEDLENVKKRMTECAMKYDKNHPASVGLEGFEAAVLSPGVFREMIKRTFNISLNPKELAAMLTLFGADRNGNIKTAGFLTKFMRIGLDERYKFKTESIEKQRAAAKAAKKEREEKIAAQWKRVEDLVDVDYEFTREDEDSAMVKLVEAAAKYDKTAVSAPSLDGFSTVFLGPGAFKEMLKRTFNLRVNGKELGALVKKFEHPEKQNHIDCQMFVINFLSIGFAERRKMKVAQANIQRQNERHAKEEHDRKMREAKQRNDLVVDYDFGEVERRKANEKLTQAAFRYDKNMPGAVSLAAFDAAYLLPGEFKEILKRTFNLRLEPGEFGAIMFRFDPDKTGKVHSKDFLNEFFKLGFAEREKMKLINIEKNRMAIKLANQEQARKLADAEQRMLREVKNEFTLDEQRSAFKKLTEAATKYDKNHPSAVGLDGFDASTLTYGIFRELIKKCFNVILSDGELAALKNFFDKKNEGFIRSKDFLVYFFKLGFAERNKFKSEQLRKDRELARQREREEQEKLQAQWAKMELDVDWNFTDKDKDSAMVKITKAAKDYDPNHPAAMSLSAFDGATMTPAVFREMLKRVMGILLTDKELGAIISLFDKEGTRVVSCPEFILRFKELGFAERARERKENLEKRAAYLKQVEEEQAAKEKAKEDKREDFVNYNFTHEEFSTAMEKLKYAASTYDKNHPSSVGLDGFQGASLTPGIFREMLKRTFGIKLGPGELGATVKFFDSDGDGSIDTAEFLKHFYKLQRVERSHIRRQRIQAERDVQMKLEAERKELETAAVLEKENKLKFGPDDEKSLMGKISDCAEAFATDSSSFVTQMQTLKGPALPPIAFREVFYRIFLVRLTYPEVGALMSVMDEAGTGSIDGTKFMNAFFRLGRVKEKVLLGEMDADTTTLEALRPHTASLGGGSGMFEPLNTTSRSSRSGISTRKGTADGSPTSSVWKESLVNSSIQASEEDIERFTDVTVGQSWVLPNVVSRSKKKSAQDDFVIDAGSSPVLRPKTVNGIPEQFFDDFEPFIVVPRSPRSANKYRPNLKELPMPTPGPPDGANKKRQIYRQTTPATGTKKAKSTSSLHRRESEEKTSGKKIEFQDISLKKTTLSKQEAAQLHLAEFRDENRLSFGQQVTKSSKNGNQGSGGAVKKKKNLVNKVVPPSPGAFFFPTLLSAAPTINLGPVGGNVSDDNAFLYEDTSNF